MESGINSAQDAKAAVQLQEVREIVVAIAAKNLTPTMLSEDFLKFSGIVPDDWKLSKQPILNPNYAQLSFQNGVVIVGQPRNVTFVETIGSKTLEQVQAPNVARFYVQKLPKAEYQSLTVSPKVIVPLSRSQEAARNYLTRTLLAPGPWQKFGQAPVQASISFLYELNRCQLSLSVNEAKLKLQDQAPVSGLLFSGSFNYQIPENTERISWLEEQISNWRSDWETFQELVNRKFLQRSLNPEESVFPTNK